MCAPSHRRRITAGTVRLHGLSVAFRPRCRSPRTTGRRSACRQPPFLDVFEVVGVFRGRGRQYSTVAPARIGWARPACQGGRSGYGPKALGRLFRSHRVHASRRLEQRAQRPVPVGRGPSGVERPDGRGAVVGGREAPGAVAVEPSVRRHAFDEQAVGAVARPPENEKVPRPSGRGWSKSAGTHRAKYGDHQAL